MGGDFPHPKRTYSPALHTQLPRRRAWSPGQGTEAGVPGWGSGGAGDLRAAAAWSKCPPLAGGCAVTWPPLHSRATRCPLPSNTFGSRRRARASSPTSLEAALQPRARGLPEVPTTGFDRTGNTDFRGGASPPTPGHTWWLIWAAQGGAASGGWCPSRLARLHHPHSPRGEPRPGGPSALATEPCSKAGPADPSAQHCPEAGQPAPASLPSLPWRVAQGPRWQPEGQDGSQTRNQEAVGR